MQNQFDPPLNAITRLSIRDFRGIEKLDFEFLRPDGKPNSLVVLSGPNGCGKTAVLEAALMAVGGEDLVVGKTGKAGVRLGKARYTIEASLLRTDGRTEPTRRMVGFPEIIDSQYPNYPGLLEPPYHHHWYFPSSRAPRLIGPLDVRVKTNGKNPGNSDASRLVEVKQKLINAAAGERFRRGPSVDTQNYTRWIDLINHAWRDYYPEGNPRFEVNLALNDIEGTGAFDVFLLRDGEESLEVDLLSSGQIELFLFLSSLILNNQKPGIIFIDEPELHLDPMWHRAIIRSLRTLQPQAQLIVATHSPEIYDAAMSFERHFLVPDTDPRAKFWPTNIVLKK